MERLRKEAAEADKPKALPSTTGSPPRPPVRYVYTPPCQVNTKVIARHKVPMGPHDAPYVYLKDT